MIEVDQKRINDEPILKKSALHREQIWVLFVTCVEYQAAMATL
jgi:hypothetical protein